VEYFFQIKLIFRALPFGLVCIPFVSKFNQIGYNRSSVRLCKTKEDSSIIYIKVSNNPNKDIPSHKTILFKRISISLVAVRHFHWVRGSFCGKLDRW